jgi:hypothetical protein
MPLVFVHGVATRPKPEYLAEVAQRSALFRQLVLHKEAVVLNPDWGSHAAKFTESLPWLPKPSGDQAYGGGEEAATPGDLGLSGLAEADVSEAVDLAIAGVLEQAVIDAGKQGKPDLAATPQLVALTGAGAAYLDIKVGDEEEPVGEDSFAGQNDAAFAATLEGQLKQASDLEAYGGLGDLIKSGFGAVGGWVGNGLSDVALKAKRADLSKAVAFFLGDIFVYLRQRDVAGAEGVAERLFKPILDALIAGFKAPRHDGEPFVVVGHSLGGVLLFDLLTDPFSLQRLAAEAPGFKIDVLTTVGSQPGFFADLLLYSGKAKAGGKLAKPTMVGVWHNVYDYTDVFSFLAKPAFEGVEDFGYNSSVDLLAAHTAYFKKPSFYQRMRKRLAGLGYP